MNNQVSLVNTSARVKALTDNFPECHGIINSAVFWCLIRLQTRGSFPQTNLDHISLFYRYMDQQAFATEGCFSLY